MNVKKTQISVEFEETAPKNLISVRPGINEKGFRDFLNDYFHKSKEHWPEREDDETFRDWDNKCNPYGDVLSADGLYEIEVLQLGIFIPYPKHHTLAGKIIIYTKSIAQYAAKQNLSFDVVFWATLANQVFRAFFSALLRTDRLPFSISSLISTTATSGSGRLFTLRGISRSM